MVLTCIIVVILQTPPDQSHHLEYVEWVEYLLYEQQVVGLHWDVYRVRTVPQQSIQGINAGHWSPSPYNNACACCLLGEKYSKCKWDRIFHASLFHEVHVRVLSSGGGGG